MNDEGVAGTNHRLIWVIFVFCFVSGFISVYAYTLSQTKPLSDIVRSEPSLTPTPFQFTVPSQAISGVLKEKQGSVLKLSRNDSGFMESTPGAQILLGESVATKERSGAAITLSDIITATLEENSELVFANLFPENTVLQQKAGKILYTVESPHPVSIRALHTLIAASSSAFLVHMDESALAVTSQKGVVKIALVDNNNDTHVWELGDGEKAVVDDISRSVRIISP